MRLLFVLFSVLSLIGGSTVILGSIGYIIPPTPQGWEIFILNVTYRPLLLYATIVLFPASLSITVDPPRSALLFHFLEHIIYKNIYLSA